jgi:hypothetical protein
VTALPPGPPPHFSCSWPSSCAAYYTHVTSGHLKTIIK